MLKPLGLQLYSLREYAAKDFVVVLKRVADIGYKCVEPAGFWGLRPLEFRKIVEDLGMTICSSHTLWANTATLGLSMEVADQLGLKTVACGYGPSDFENIDAIKRTADTVNAMADTLKKNGFTLFQHNHYWEFDKIDGRFMYDIYAEYATEVKFEIDSFWSTNRGLEDAVAILRNFAGRTILSHMKDGICTRNGNDEPEVKMLPLGEGNMPIKNLVDAMPEQVQAIIVELDFCSNKEMFQAVEESYKFMTSNGLALGNK